MRFLLSLVFILTITQSTSAALLDLYYQKQLLADVPVDLIRNVDEAWFDQLIDHNIVARGRFKQRYFVDETFVKGDDAPTFLYACGEAACDKRYLGMAIRNWAEEHHARLVALEHRYYGESLPVTSFSVDNLSLLSTKQAIEDLAYFQRAKMQDNGWRGKWIVFGGSYPGMLAAFYRAQHPELVSGALASSAPVEARELVPEFDAAVSQTLDPACHELVRQVVTEIESAQYDQDKLSDIKNKMKAEDIDDFSDLLFFTAELVTAPVQYGQVDMFCNMMKHAATPIDGIANVARFFYQVTGMSATSLTPKGALSENPKDYQVGIGLGIRQWYYQSCSEYGFWQIADPNTAFSTRSQLINSDYFSDVCMRLFGLTTKSNADQMNRTYLHPITQQASNIFFSNGDSDPWRVLSLSDERDNTQNKQLDYFTIKQSSHCVDLGVPKGTDSPSLKDARRRFNKHLSLWLNAR